MNTKTKGQITEASVALALLQMGKTVLTPYGENQRYDLVLEEESGFRTIQCKTGRLRGGSVRFNLYSVVRDKETKGWKKVKYGTAVDYYGVHCPDNRKNYLVPVSLVGTSEGSLSIKDPETMKLEIGTMLER